MVKPILTETYIVNRVKAFLINDIKGNWHEDKLKIADLHGKGPDIQMVGGKRNSEHYIIECKGKSYAKSARSINKEGRLNALGQIITRMNQQRIIQKGKSKGDVNRAYKYGLGLYWVSAQVALRRIPKNIAKTLNLHIFSCNDNGEIRHFTQKDFGTNQPDEKFI